MTSLSSSLSILVLTAAPWLTGCAGGGGPPQIVFESHPRPGGVDTTFSGGTNNIWLVGSDGKGLRALTKATDADSADSEWSTDGSIIVFVSRMDLPQNYARRFAGAYNVWRVNANGTDLMPLTTVTDVRLTRFPEWSPDGMSVAFESSRNLDGSDTENSNDTRNIWRVNTDGTNLRPLTNATAVNADSINPQWSPDGTKIVFTSFRKTDGTDAGSMAGNIWLVNADGTNLVPITRSTYVSNLDPQWSPAGTKVLFSSDRALDGTETRNAATNLWQVNLDGTGLRPLTNTTTLFVGNCCGRWAPDGGKIVFLSDRKPDGSDGYGLTTNLWRMNSDGSEVMPLTRAKAALAGGFAPRWSRDGTQVVFYSSRNVDGTDSSNPNHTTNIWRVNADGTELMPLTTATSGADNSSPSFGP